MSKGKRLKKTRKVDKANSDFFCQIFLGKDTEPITDELITQLVKEKGMSGEELKYLQKQGATYCRPRDSFLAGPEI